MARNLVIYPIKENKNFDASKLLGGILAYDCLNFDPDYGLFGQIADSKGRSRFSEEGLEVVLQTKPLPKGLEVIKYEEEGEVRTRKDAYGNQIGYTTAGEMSKLKPSEESSPKNKAILAFTKALPKETLIVLDYQ